MQAKGAELELRDISKDRLSAAELDELIGDRDYRLFLNPRNELYRERKMKGEAALARRSDQADGRRAESDSPPGGDQGPADCARV